MSPPLCLQFFMQSPLALLLHLTLPMIQSAPQQAASQLANWGTVALPALKVGQQQSATGLLYCQLRLWEQAIAAYSQALTAFYSARDWAALGRTYCALSLICAQRQQYGHAKDYAALALRQLSAADQPSDYGAALHYLGVAQYYRGRNRAALNALEKALAIRQQQQDTVGQALTLSMLGRVHLALAQPWHALTCYRQALGFCTSQEPLFEGNWYRAVLLGRIADAAQRCGDSNLALVAYHEALEHSQEMNNAWVGRTLRQLGCLYEVLQQPTLALHYHRQTHQILKQVPPQVSNGQNLALERDRNRMEGLKQPDPIDQYF